LRVDIGARSDVGRKHTHNEDCYCVLRELGLFVVSDGIGGQAKGEVASAMAVEAISTHCLQATSGAASSVFREVRSNLSAKTCHLANAVRWANRKIRSAASRDPACVGMGATLVAAWLNGQDLSLVNIGDSRAYLFRAGTLKQLTHDHSLAAERARRGLTTQREAQTSTLQNILLRALGTEDKIELEAEDVALQHGDVVLLCTDGLTHMVTDSELGGVLAAQESAQLVTDRLIDLANARGGKDNVTVVVLRVEQDGNGLLEWLRRHFGRWGNGRVLPEGNN
jgi:PPM family protein phosphatase